MNNARMFGNDVITEEMAKNLMMVEYVHKSLEIAKVFLDNGIIDRDEYVNNLKKAKKLFES